MRVFNGRGPFNKGGGFAGGGMLRSGASVNLNPTFSADYVNDTYFIGSGYTTASAIHTVTRSTSKYVENASGLWTSVSANTLARSDLGAPPEESRTNVALWNRDLTNAVWTKTNVTAAKNQAGVDGVANSASSITATASNGTCLQAITLASSARWQTAFVKRLTGSGTVQMTMDNGTTWTAVTVTAGWTRVAIPTQTLLNPTVGFRLVTSGDAIAVDFVQNENSGIHASSPIETTTVAVTRAGDVITIDSKYASFAQGSAYLRWKEPTNVVGISRRLFALFVDVNNVIFATISSGGFIQVQVISGGIVQANIVSSGTVVGGNTYKLAMRWALNDVTVALTSTLNGAIQTDTSATMPTGTPVIGIGQSGGGGNFLNAPLLNMTLFHRKLSNAELEALVA